MQLTPHLHQLTIPFTVPTPCGALPRTVNLYVLVGRRITLIDSGVAGSETQVVAYLQRTRPLAAGDRAADSHPQPSRPHRRRRGGGGAERLPDCGACGRNEPGSRTRRARRRSDRCRALPRWCRGR